MTVPLFALRIYIFARCALADTEFEPLMDAMERYPREMTAGE